MSLEGFGENFEAFFYEVKSRLVFVDQPGPKVH